MERREREISNLPNPRKRRSEGTLSPKSAERGRIVEGIQGKERGFAHCGAVMEKEESRTCFGEILIGGKRPGMKEGRRGGEGKKT